MTEELRVCLSTEEVALLAAGAARSANHTELLAHVETCEACRIIVGAALRAARSGDPTVAEGAGEELNLGTVVGRYVIVGWLGAGGMGRVYAAHDPQLARTIALKVLRASPSSEDAEAFARLAREAQLTARLSHPNVVAVHDVGVHDGRVFVAMELVEGETLRAWLRAEPRGWRAITSAFVQAGRGLAAAHAAGLVHRDIKPDNILVGTDGRVRVGDFGLARAITAEGEAAAPELERVAGGKPAWPSGTLTATGAVLGTIAYMAPEQLEGGACDERSDQFSFCVALYEALHGVRPFTGDSVDELRTAFAGGPKPAGGDKVPGWVRAAVLRGLARSPASRFPSMTALLEALASDPRARLRRGALGVVAAGALVVAVRWLSDGSVDPCSDAGREIATVWNDQVKAELGAQFAAVGAPYASDAWASVAKSLDGYARSWATEHRAACRATRVDEHQSEAMLDLRMVCLDRGKQELAAVAGALRKPTGDVAQRAVALVQSMAPIARCADLDALRAPVAPPQDEALAAQVRALEAQLANLSAATRIARYDGLEREAEAIVERATALGYQPTIADAWLARGELAAALGDSKGAEQLLYEALWAAQAGRHRRTEVIAWSKLLVELGTQQARHDDGLRMFRHALAALEGHGDDGRLRGQILLGAGMLFRNRGEYDRATAQLDGARTAIASLRDDTRLELGAIENAAGTVALTLGKYDDALARFERALDIRRRAQGAHHPDVGKALLNIGSVYKDRHDYARALENYEAAERVFRAALPASHPNLGAVDGNIGLVLMEQGKYAEALVRQHAALANLEANRGPAHPAVADELSNIGLTLTYAKRQPEAIPYFERARAILVKALGPEHLKVAMTDHNLGLAYKGTGDLAKAEDWLQSAIAIRKKIDPDHPELARAMQVLATMWTITRRYAEAAELLAASLVITEKAHGPDSMTLARPLLDLGWIRNRQGRPADAIAPLERAVAIRVAKAPDDRLLSVARLELANALWDSKRDRGRAVEQVTLARRSLDPATQGKDVAELDAWLARHRLR